MNNKGFWKGFGYGFVATLPLSLMLNGAFWLLQKLGIMQPATTTLNVILFVSTYIVVITIYLLGARLYFRKKSSDNLEKLKREVEEVTGKKLS